jgi:hypothetical protein
MRSDSVPRENNGAERRREARFLLLIMRFLCFPELQPVEPKKELISGNHVSIIPAMVAESLSDNQH